MIEKEKLNKKRSSREVFSSKKSFNITPLKEQQQWRAPNFDNLFKNRLLKMQSLVVKDGFNIPLHRRLI